MSSKEKAEYRPLLSPDSRDPNKPSSAPLPRVTGSESNLGLNPLDDSNLAPDDISRIYNSTASSQYGALIGALAVLLAINAFAAIERALRQAAAVDHLVVGPVTFLSFVWLLDILAGVYLVTLVIGFGGKKLYSSESLRRHVKRYSLLVRIIILTLAFNVVFYYTEVLVVVNTSIGDIGVNVNSAVAGVVLILLAVRVYFHVHELTEQSSLNKFDDRLRMFELTIGELADEEASVAVRRARIDRFVVPAFVQMQASSPHGFSNTLYESSATLARAIIGERGESVDVDGDVPCTSAAAAAAAPDTASVQVASRRSLTRQRAITRNTFQMCTSVRYSSLFDALDVDGDGVINTSDLRTSILSVYRARLKLRGSASTSALQYQIGELVAGVLAWMLSACWVLIAFDVELVSVFVPLGTALVAISFAYASTLQQLFDSLYLIFVARPFVCGDIICINDGEELIVSQVGVFSTMLHSNDGLTRWVRNANLSHSRITIFRLTEFAQIEVCVLLKPETTAEAITALRVATSNFLKRSPALWHPVPIVLVMEPSSSHLNRQAMRFGLQVMVKGRLRHLTWQNRVECREARTAMVCFLEEYLSQHQLNGRVLL